MSKNLILRLCLMLALVGAAAIFDMYQASTQKLADRVREIPDSDETGTYKLIFCNQVPTSNLKTSGTDFSIRFRFEYAHAKFLQKHYNLRTFQLMKAETLLGCFPKVSSCHFLPFNRVLYTNPDDLPPLS